MTAKEFANETAKIAKEKTSAQELASALEQLWLKGEIKSTSLITEELKTQLKVVGIDVAILKAMGKAIGKIAKKDFDKYIELSRLLWQDFGLEGRIVAAHTLSGLNLKYPEAVLELCKTLLASCITWAECDNMAYALEPAIRKDPENYLDSMDSLLNDDNKWVKRGALNVLARLPMKQPDFTVQALEKVTSCLDYADNDVRRTCSFAIRMAARGNISQVVDFIRRQLLLSTNANRIWIFSDVIRSMTKSFLPDFKSLLADYQGLLANTDDPRSRKSLEAAIKLLG